MRSNNAAYAVVRTAFAAIFGLMSLLHAPIMASANTATPTVHHVATAHPHAADHFNYHPQHTRYPGQKSTPAMPDAVPSCFGIGCFVVVEPVVATTPPANTNLIATLSPAEGDAMVPTYLDPAVPPPRSQV